VKRLVRLRSSGDVAPDPRALGVKAPDPDRPPRVGRRQFWRAALGVLAVVGLTAVGASLFVRTEVTVAISRLDNRVKRIQQVDTVLTGVKAGDPQTILVLGSDHRAGPAARGMQSRWGNSDTMMLLRLNPKAPATTVLSIPRDLQVEIPGVGLEKINAAYSEGGPKLAIKTLHDSLGIEVNHVVDVDFLGFERAVNALHCIYTDVDRRYFNDNNPPNGGAGPYAVIDVKAGYQRLCGEDALSYVRFRHLDSDFLRAARQQSFVNQAKSQLPLGTLLSEGGTLLDTLADQTATDVHSSQWLQVLALAVKSADHPVVQLKFPGDTPEPAYEGAPSYVTVTPENLRQVVADFLDPKTAAKPKAKAKKKKAKRKKTKKRAADANAIPAGLTPAGPIAAEQRARLARKVGFPVYAPTLMTDTGQYPELGTRAYKIEDRDGHRYDTYRMVVDSGLGGPGHYYGVQGMTWKNPPLLDGGHDTIEEGGRELDVYYDGKRVRLVAWKADGAVYWVSNTLQSELSYGQMVGIAKSLSAKG